MSQPLPRRAAEVLVVLLVVVGLFAVVTATDRGAEAATDEPRTWVVDAVDDLYGARWVAADTGTDRVTVAVGDTVEWQFDQAVVDHDLTSQDTGSAWEPAVEEYRRPGDGPVRHTFTEPGSYDYLCSIHGTVMRGTIVVLAPEPGNTAPTATAVVDRASGPAPLTVHFSATASDPDGDPLNFHWAFGTGADAEGAAAAYTYDTPGTYTATLQVSDGRGGTTVHHVPITVTAGLLPDVTAVAAPAPGAGSLAVAFATEVSTTGAFAAYADGLATYPDLAGSAGLVRARGRTTAHLEATGLDPGGAHLVHVHEQACAAAHGGAHFRFDETRPFAAVNEIWLPFTADAAGRSGRIEVAQPLRAGAKAVSIVIHDPDNPAKRIGCVDLVPETADLSYAWDFGDGTTAAGPDPDHVYAAAGSYVATVTVGRPAQQRSVSATVRVVVGSPAEAPATGIAGGPVGVVRVPRATFRLTGGSAYTCRLDGADWRTCTSPHRVAGLRDGRHRLEVRATDAAGRTDPTPAVRRWTVDTTAPTIRVLDGRRPVVRIRVHDRLSGVRRADVVVRVDGRRVRPAWSDGRLTLRPTRGPGVHVVTVAATDGAGNRRVVRWRLR